MAFLANSHLQYAFIILLIVLPLSSVFATLDKANCTINLGDKPMPAHNDSKPWESPSGEFAFGFRSVAVDGDYNHFLLAIWFKKISPKTIVWFANGDSPAVAGSQVSLNENGELVLNNDSRTIWKPQTVNGSEAVCAALLDTGNLVLLNADYKSIWESFNEPKNTILPSQIMGVPSNLTSCESNTDYSTGPFQLQVQTDHNLVLYLVARPTGNQLQPYFATNTWINKTTTPSKNVKLVFDEEDGSITLFDGNVTLSKITTENPGSMQDYYHRATLDPDGVFRQYKYSKGLQGNDVCSADWSLVEQTPDNICLAFRSDLGGGTCGFNSYCKQSGPLSRHSCECPKGYSHLDPSDENKGCRPDFQFPSCTSGGWEKRNDLVKFTEIKDTDWPQSDYDLHVGVEKDECRDICRDDCFCAAAIFREDKCWKKKFPLSHGRTHASINGTAFIKVPVANANESLQRKCGQDKSTLVLVGSLLLGSSVFLNFLLLISISAVIYFSFQKKLQNMQSTSDTTNIIRYTYKELENATSNFKLTLGKGAFGTVYKGVLGYNVKRFVAVKRLDKIVEEGEKEFKTEVNVIGQTHHKNLVRLLGYCDEGQHRLLVYEYMSNGSLSTFLFGISKPDWNQRVQIAFGIARGITYLHEECMSQIIHCDIKPQNILLDDNYTPRISDFGLAKLLLGEQTRVAHTGMRGTIGYFAPEWFWKASISVKVDIFSFGVMLLEIICCDSSISFAMKNQEKALIDWVYECYVAKKLEKVVENDEEAKNDMKRLERMVMVAIWCIQEDPSLRPSMKKVTQMLEGVIQVSVAPRPFMYSSTTTNSSHYMSVSTEWPES